MPFLLLTSSRYICDKYFTSAFMLKANAVMEHVLLDKLIVLKGQMLSINLFNS